MLIIRLKNDCVKLYYNVIDGIRKFIVNIKLRRIYHEKSNIGGGITGVAVLISTILYMSSAFANETSVEYCDLTFGEDCGDVSSNVGTTNKVDKKIDK